MISRTISPENPLSKMDGLLYTTDVIIFKEFGVFAVRLEHERASYAIFEFVGTNMVIVSPPASYTRENIPLAVNIPERFPKAKELVGYHFSLTVVVSEDRKRLAFRVQALDIPAFVSLRPTFPLQCDAIQSRIFRRCFILYRGLGADVYKVLAPLVLALTLVETLRITNKDLLFEGRI